MLVLSLCICKLLSRLRTGKVPVQGEKADFQLYPAHNDGAVAARDRGICTGNEENGADGYFDSADTSLCRECIRSLLDPFIQ